MIIVCVFTTIALINFVFLCCAAFVLYVVSLIFFAVGCFLALKWTWIHYLFKRQCALNSFSIYSSLLLQWPLSKTKQSYVFISLPTKNKKKLFVNNTPNNLCAIHINWIWLFFLFLFYFQVVFPMKKIVIVNVTLVDQTKICVNVQKAQAYQVSFLFLCCCLRDFFQVFSAILTFCFRFRFESTK